MSATTSSTAAVEAPPGVRTANGVLMFGNRPVRPVLIMVVFCLGLFMTLLDITIVNIAIPDLVTELRASLETVLWVGSAYSLFYAALLITAGRLGDIIGPRTVFLIGLSLFTVASLASGLAQSPGQLIAFRGAQGLGAALLAPQGLPIITSVLKPEQRGAAFAATGIMSGLGMLLGPTLGGFVVTHFGWRWIFFINVPIGIIAAVLAFAFMPDVRPGLRHRLDLMGVALLTVGLLGVVFGLIEGERYSWGTISGILSIPLVLVAGGVFLGLFLWRQVRLQSGEPLLPFGMFRDRTFTVMTLVLLAAGFAMVGVFLPITIYYQSVLGLSAVAAGVVMGVQSLAMMFASGIAGGAGGSGKVSMKWVLFAGLVMFGVGVLYIIVVAKADSSKWAFVPGLLVSGIGMGCVWTPLFGLATRDLDPAQAGVASGVLDTLQEFGSVLATAILGAVLANRLTADLALEAKATVGTLPGGVQQSFLDGMARAGEGGIRVGAGQASEFAVQSGVSGSTADAIKAAASHTFASGFTDAMKPTMVVPVIVILAAAVAVLTVRPKGRKETEAQEAALLAAVDVPEPATA
ncbi:EmrB/QacA subfamily drug resistance transporter [Nakamurella sp. UYEF19]|uniref:DHA2 family efflux MFS transporter permease subunit n=1 Tax=Nakamurella sp. UYEF19 TaxID=1756392 RepID=UPI003395BD0E